MRKMVMTVIPRDQAGHVLDCLIAAGYGVTYTESRGGMLRQAQLMLFVAVDTDKVGDVINIIKAECHVKVALNSGVGSFPMGVEVPDAVDTADVGYAVVFVWDLEHFATY